MRVIGLADSPKRIPNFNVLWPGHPECPFDRSGRDEEWIPYAGMAGWIVIHRDEKILKVEHQWNLVCESKLGMVVLRGAGDQKMEVVDSLLQTVWRKLHEYRDQPLPWVIQAIYVEPEPIIDYFDHHRINRSR